MSKETTRSEGSGSQSAGRESTAPKNPPRPPTPESRPLPSEVLAEIREIFAKIDSGEYQHCQSGYSGNGNDLDCGTSHCIAGWKVARDQAVNYPQRTPWSYARDAWGLTFLEANRLFGMHRTRPEQDALVELWEKGERLYD